MDQLRPISIVGGGLAGLTLGIALRQQSVPVVIREAGRYPRHRVCGEFISGRGQETLRRLGLLDLLLTAGARSATTIAFVLEDRAFPARALPKPAVCLSRFQLDALLAAHFRHLGGVLECESRWPEQAPDEGMVHAGGRRSQASESGWRWFGLKAHARKVPLSADLEMHLTHDAYVGLCRLNSEEVNICGLFRGRRQEATEAKSVIERLRTTGSGLLQQRLAGAEWDPDSACAVAGLSLSPRRAAGTSSFRIGDALTMIAPVTGNGMSMAFESAELAIEPLLAYSRGEHSWEQATKVVAQSCDTAFAQRLRWAWRFQRSLFNPAIGRMILPFAGRSEILWRWLFHVTR